jgi:hypothetical protein
LVGVVSVPGTSMAQKKIFLSYNHKDKKKAHAVLNRLEKLEPDFSVWFDRHSIQPGQRLSDKITEALDSANYYVILISENSNQSEWVKRELSAAFDLSMKTHLALVPFVIDDAKTPLEFRGQLTINAKGDNFDNGLDDLVNFFKGQTKHGIVLGAGVGRTQTCETELSQLDYGDLRFLLAARLTIPEVAVLWYDIFNTQMENEVAPTTLAQYCVALIEKAKRLEYQSKFYKMICRNHPRLGELAEMQ